MYKSTLIDEGAEGYTVAGPAGQLTFWRGAGGDGAARDPWGTEWTWRGNPGVLQLNCDGPFVESAVYPNAFERIAGALELKQSGEIWVTARPGCEFEVPGGKAHCGGASHGALHALDSFSVLIAANAPMKLPRFVRSIDIAPICLAALGLPSPYAVGEPRVRPPRP